MPKLLLAAWNSCRCADIDGKQRDTGIRLAEDLIDEGPIREKTAGDAVHIAVATVFGCEFLLTWNCRHIAMPNRTEPSGVWSSVMDMKCRICARRKN